MTDTTTTRRGLLSGGLAAAAVTAAGATGLSRAAAEEAAAQSAHSGITAETLAQAEKLHDLRYTADEREQILNTIQAQVDGLAALRALDHPNDLAPALVFDPRLPDRAYASPGGGVHGPGADRPARPTADDDVAFAPAHVQARWIRAGELSSRALVEIYLKRIARHRPQLENFVTVTADLARAQADRADADLARGRVRSSLHGVPYGLKDLADTAGLRTSWGATPYRDRIADDTATLAARLDAAGCPLLGKTTLGALAYGDIWFGGVTRNPWNPAEGSSGSSAGSASATAAGLVGFAIGTETLGSIVSPSQRCGTTGLRPSFGRISRAGAMALCWSLDKVGPTCRSVEDSGHVLAILNGADRADPSSLDMPFGWDRDRPADELVVGYDPAWFEADDATDVDRAALAALRDLGVTLREVSLPDLPYGALTRVVTAEAAAAFEELTLSDRDDSLRWQDDRAWPNGFRTIRFFSAVDMIQTDRLRRRVMRVMAERFEGVDALIHPNFAASLLVIGNFTGHPTLSLRAGFIDRAPRGLFRAPKDPDAPKVRTTHNVSLTGPLFREDRLLTLGRALETALGVADARPPLG
ncbi:amidase [Rhodothalassium salexigens]|uniref:amidase n=1 Tax=Rhodothalassium salexigens TaxID=1086 RepID=UPI001912466D|nr:amidase [Rhodothalassium salexigens]MBK5911820.1 amidase [Rhodothalassium salexigens]